LYSEHIGRQMFEVKILSLKLKLLILNRIPMFVTKKFKLFTENFKDCHDKCESYLQGVLFTKTINSDENYKLTGQ
jgi:hypothetical protein